MVVLAADFKKSLEGTTIDEVLKKPQFAGYVKTANIQVSKLNGYIGGLSNAESIVRWAYSDAKIGESADFQLPSGKVVAVLSKFKKKGEAKFEDVREEIIPLAKNSLKGASSASSKASGAKTSKAPAKAKPTAKSAKTSKAAAAKPSAKQASPKPKAKAKPATKKPAAKAKAPAKKAPSTSTKKPLRSIMKLKRKAK